MKTLIDLITEQVTNAFTGQGYDAKYGKVTLSNRPDLCEYQCNGAMAAAKEYKCAPFMISDKIAQALAENELFESVESVKPGFINMKVSPAYLAKYVSDMKADEGRFGCDKAAHPKTIIVDYGGANVAKPLHVGHLRSAVIGESRSCGLYLVPSKRLRWRFIASRRVNSTGVNTQKRPIQRPLTTDKSSRCRITVC